MTIESILTEAPEDINLVVTSQWVTANARDIEEIPWEKWLRMEFWAPYTEWLNAILNSGLWLKIPL